MILLALTANLMYTRQLGQSSVMAYGPSRAGRFYHGD